MDSMNPTFKLIFLTLGIRFLYGMNGDLDTSPWNFIWLIINKKGRQWMSAFLYYSICRLFCQESHFVLEYFNRSALYLETMFPSATILYPHYTFLQRRNQRCVIVEDTETAIATRQRYHRAFTFKKGLLWCDDFNFHGYSRINVLQLLPTFSYLLRWPLRWFLSC